MSQPHALKARIAAVSFATALLLGFFHTPAAAENCDRACLSGLLTQYIDAVVARDPSRLPLAENVRFTEDSEALKLGEGLWQATLTKGTFRQDYLDTRKQIAATHVQLLEGKNQVLLSALLHVKDRKIAGIETLVQRVTPESRLQPKELGKPIRGMNDPVPANKKQSRESMIKTALTYTEGLRIGNFTDAGTPFAPEAYRVENGVIMAGEGCGRDDCGLYSQNIMVHPGIIASVAAVDEENGVVLLWMNFGHTGSSYGEGNSLVTFEAFKVWGGQIHAINAFFRGLPISTARFWPSADPVYK
ncbi:MAG: hypothetical protein IRZ28_06530 [Steroidobacteraceae bacterium]|nr:hypothetical protein [Steroidobacteraceae bacterium]